MAAVSRLVRWLPKAVEATADDIARFGPNAGRIRQLLDFLPTMSDEAVRATSSARRAVLDELPPTSWNNETLRFADVKRNFDESGIPEDAWYRAVDTAWNKADPRISASAHEAVAAEVVPSEYFSAPNRELYESLTRPLATGRAVDLLRARPRYQGTPFLDVVQNLAGRGMVTGPRDVVRAGRIARAPEDVREIALTLIADGMSPADALRAARML